MRKTEKVARYIEDEKFQKIPGRVIEKAKDCLLDYLGSCLAGSKTQAGRLTFDLIQKLFPPGNCPLIGTNLRSTVPGAVWGNGVSGSAWDYDDGHRAPLKGERRGAALGQAAGHPGAAVIPAALAFSFEHSASGPHLLESIVVGYEVGLRIAASRRPSTVLANVTGNWATFGAAVSGGKVLDLSAETLENLLGVAAGNLINPPSRISLTNMTMIKESVGWAGLTGAVACFMAQAGITGLPDVLDNENFYECSFFDDLGEDYATMNVYFKPYSCCRIMHPALDAALSMRRDHDILIDDIQMILVETSPKAAGMTNHQPRTIEEAQYSIPFCLATILKYGKLTPALMQTRHLNDPDILSLAHKVRIAVDQAQDKEGRGARFPRNTAARVTVTMGRGMFSSYVDSPTGDPETPLMRHQIIEKFKEMAGGTLGHEAVEKALRFVLNLDEKRRIADLAGLLMVDCSR